VGNASLSSSITLVTELPAFNKLCFELMILRKNLHPHLTALASLICQIQLSKLLILSVNKYSCVVSSVIINKLNDTTQIFIMIVPQCRCSNLI